MQPQYVSIRRVATTGRAIAKHVAYLAALILLPVNLSAAALGVANAYNVFVFNNLTLTGADSGGRVAVGGNASMPGFYSIGQSILDSFTAPNNLTLEVDGSITAGPANVYNGNAYEGTAGASYASMNGGTFTIGGPKPINVAAEQGWLAAYSAQLSQLASNSNVVVNGSNVTLTGTDPTLEVFNLAIANLGGNNSVNINVNPNATVLINVSGASVTTSSAGFFLNGTQILGNSATGYQKILFNFYQATSITFGGSFEGTVLATNANVSGSNGQLDGGLIAKSFTGNTEFHDLLFTGNLPSAVPEPGTWAMIFTGVVCAALARTRRNH